MYKYRTGSHILSYVSAIEVCLSWLYFSLKQNTGYTFDVWLTHHCSMTKYFKHRFMSALRKYMSNKKKPSCVDFEYENTLMKLLRWSPGHIDLYSIGEDPTLKILWCTKSVFIYIPVQVLLIDITLHLYCTLIYLLLMSSW